MNTIDNCHMISTNLGIKNTHETKHKHYLETIRVACNAISPTNKEDLEIARDSLIIAAQQGNADLIVEAIKAEFSLLWTRDKSTGSSIFHLSIKYRQAEVFNLIHGVIQKERFFSFEDNDGNNMLHLAGMLAPSSYLKKVSGAALQMQRELQWFKEVENIMPPMKRKSLNKYGMTPREVFTRDHNDLVKQGEKWMKGTATSCSLVAALVATITFAAAFTVPGGNDQNNGYPIFLQKTFLDKKLFMIFIISDAMSLFSSSTSLFIFLALLTSRYAEDDFLTSLPTRLIIGLLTVFISLIAMMIAFCAALFLMIQAKTWIIIPAALLACVPLILYIWLQIPLLANMFKSTYMPSIFERNAKSWP
ncbi:hypothetical protein RIF29_08558 [Crotalaria pallida]|uniref:PGG domain-containing protein n=1 Tax=Crotalaria pallida TaxID=3830 RepID=A0AAN9FQZ5_CROPI